MSAKPSICATASAPTSRNRPTTRPKCAVWSRNIADLEYIVCDTELEALVLECNLIKKYQPHYNVRLRDDKQYPYLCLTLSEPFPRLLVVRRVRQDSNKYFGPYPNSRSVYATMELVNRIFPLISCGKSFDGRPVQKPCLYHHMGQCLAPCAGLADKEEYRASCKDVSDFLEGREEQHRQEAAPGNGRGGGEPGVRARGASSGSRSGRRGGAAAPEGDHDGAD